MSRCKVDRREATRICALLVTVYRMCSLLRYALFLAAYLMSRKNTYRKLMKEHETYKKQGPPNDDPVTPSTTWLTK